MTRPTQRARDDAGISLIELSIVLVVLTTLSMLISESIKGLATTQVYTRGQAQVIDVSERLVQSMARDVRFAVKVFVNRPTDLAFFEYMDMPTGNRLDGSRLPLASNEGSFDVDPVGKEYTGNLLFIVATAPHALVDLSVAQDGSDLLRIDTYQYLMYHLVDRDGKIDIGRWASRTIGSYSDVMAISDTTRRSTAVQRLFEQGIGTAWDKNAVAAAAYYFLDGESGALTACTSPSQKPVQTSREESVLYLLVNRNTEVAPNGSVSRIAVPKFATATSAFPHGFELKIDGGGAGRLVLMRLVLTRRDGAHAPNSAEVMRMASIRDI